MIPIRAVLTDIEGTTTRISFVREVLFPYAQTRLSAFLDRRGSSPEVAAELAEVHRMAPGKPAVETLQQWMERDLKVPPLKTLQGLIWREGYADGSLRGDVYPDVPPCLRQWKYGGLQLYAYSSGSVEAQKLIFTHSVAGDLTPLFSGFFDTRVGGKRGPESYGRLAIGVSLPPVEILFLSDVEEELDAAAAAGMRTCQVVRADDGTQPSERHITAADFDEVAARLGLPHAS
jgi:enolase-phosphatase E1